MTDITERLRESAKAARALDRAALLEEAAGEIEKLRQHRSFWMRAASAFDEHLATMRVALMEAPERLS